MTMSPVRASNAVIEMKQFNPKCCCCGRFIARKEFEEGSADQSYTPDSELTVESIEHYHVRCLPESSGPYAFSYGYALAIHGSVMRDLDVVAVPWTEDASEPQELVDAFAKAIAFLHVDEKPEVKLHGRMVWTLAFPGTCFVDLSIMPKSEGVNRGQ